MSTPLLTIDGNEAVARVAYRLNEVIAIYPITPASPMGEWADAWAAEGRPNLWGSVPSVVELHRSRDPCMQRVGRGSPGSSILQVGQ